jgi:hypothetical protein
MPTKAKKPKPTIKEVVGMQMKLMQELDEIWGLMNRFSIVIEAYDKHFKVNHEELAQPILKERQKAQEKAEKELEKKRNASN